MIIGIWRNRLMVGQILAVTGDTITTAIVATKGAAIFPGGFTDEPAI